jgi:AhpD family alkylhydroperoxidase
MDQSTNQFLALADRPFARPDKHVMEDPTMHDRAYLPKVAPDTYAAIRDLDATMRRSGLEPSLIELVYMRASQINGCAFCLDMHSRDARKHGETEQRLYVLNAWRETPYYSDRERAALAWTECLTRLPTDGAPDTAYQALEANFTGAEIGNLTALIGVINIWNRVAVGLNWPMPPAMQRAA